MSTPDEAQVAEWLAHDALAACSVRVLLDGQSPSGAYVASPTFSQYGYGWLRDGSFCALAMQAVGQWPSVWAFHRWVMRAVNGQRERLQRAMAALSQGQAVTPDQMMPTRYQLDGSAEAHQSNWPNFQLDGYGTWLFALNSACSQAGEQAPVLSGVLEVVRDVADYLTMTWRLPCYDYWEESPTDVHTSTLAAIAAGLYAASKLCDDDSYAQQAGQIVAYLLQRCLDEEVFVKGVDDHRVDASLLSLAVPFGLVPLDDARFQRTLDRIRADLLGRDGGVRRYLGDQYYGGSPWVLLTAWLAWCDRLRGDDANFQNGLEWVRRACGPSGTLPEQVLRDPQFPSMVAVWQKRWGPVADPLLWSHAKYLLSVAGPEAMTWN